MRGFINFPVMFLIAIGGAAVVGLLTQSFKMRATPEVLTTEIVNSLSTPLPTIKPKSVKIKVEAGANPLSTSAGSLSPSTSSAPDVSVVKITETKEGTKIEMTEEDLSKLVSSELIGQDLGETPIGVATVKEVSVDLKEQMIDVRGTAQAGFVSLPILIKVGVSLKDQKPTVLVESAKVGEFPLPSFVEAKITGLFQSEVDKQLAKNPMEIKSIEITEDKFSILGTKK